MELDKRIKSKLDILTCFDIEEAKQLIGQKGYFSDFIENYQNLAHRCYGTLIEIKDGTYTFECDATAQYWRYFIPESKLLEIKKKPCTLDDFGLNIGDLIRFRRKDNHDYKICTMYMGYIKNNGIVKVLLGNIYYSLEELFSHYEWYDNDSDTWEPFGVEE